MGSTGKKWAIGKEWCPDVWHSLWSSEGRPPDQKRVGEAHGQLCFGVSAAVNHCSKGSKVDKDTDLEITAKANTLSLSNPEGRAGRDKPRREWNPTLMRGGHLSVCRAGLADNVPQFSHFTTREKRSFRVCGAVREDAFPYQRGLHRISVCDDWDCVLRGG